MKKTKSFGWALMTAILSLSACNNDVEEIPIQENEIKLTSEIIPTRVTSLDYQSTQIIEGQQVGVTITGGKSVHKNVAWTVGKDGEMTNTDNPVYWKDEEATITAYHPYHSAWTSTSHDFSVRTNQSKEENYRNSDLLWVTTTTTKTENAIPLVFDHKLAKVNVTLVAENEDMDLSEASIYICGTKIKTTFNPTTGVLTNASNIQDIKAGVTTNDAYTASAIVIPQTVGGNTQFIKVVHNDKIYSYKTGNEGKVLKAGYSHNYTLTIKEAEMKLVSANIINWENEENLATVEEEDLSWFNPDQYITYVMNKEWLYVSDNTYQYSSYIDCPITSFSKIEFKFKMNESSGDNCYLCCKNRAKDNTSAILMNNNGLKFDYDQYDDDDSPDNYKDYSYTWEELNATITDEMTLTVSFKDQHINLNGVELDYKMIDYSSFQSYYLFTYYSSENDEGIWRVRGQGIPEGSKLYYVKMWDENDNLVYLGGASKALNPKTNVEEYCWRSYYNGKYNYEFAYYPETLSNYAPYGGGTDNN